MLRRRAALLLTLCTCLAAAGSGGRALGAEFEVKPFLGVGEEYNDNIFDTATGRRSDFVTRVQPGGTLLYRSAALSADLNYGFEYRNYARGSRGDEKVHTLGANLSAEVAENFFFITASDTLSRVSLDVARDVAGESLFLNQTDQNSATVSPYLLWRPAQRSTLKTGYRFIDTRYWTVSGNQAGIDKQEHVGFAELTHQPAARVTVTAAYAFTRASTELLDYDQHDVSGSARYEYAEKSFLYGGVGNSWQSFSGSGSASNLFWNAGIENDFKTVVTTLEARVRYTDDPLTVSTKETTYSAKVEKSLRHGTVSVTGGRTAYHATTGTTADRHSTALTFFGHYDITPSLAAALTAIGDKVSGPTAGGYPYRLNASAALSYLFNYDISGALTYNYVEYRRDLDQSDGARRTNRVLLDLRKVF